MPLHSAAAVSRALFRNGVAVSVRRKAGTLDLVTSRRTSAAEIQVDTIGVRRRDTQRSKLGDPLSTVDAYYLVPLSPFRGVFEPRDGDLVLSGDTEYRVLSVRKRFAGRGEAIGYELAVSGVAL